MRSFLEIDRPARSPFTPSRSVFLASCAVHRYTPLELRFTGSWTSIRWLATSIQQPVLRFGRSKQALGRSKQGGAGRAAAAAHGATGARSRRQGRSSTCGSGRAEPAARLQRRVRQRARVAGRLESAAGSSSRRARRGRRRTVLYFTDRWTQM